LSRGHVGLHGEQNNVDSEGVVARPPPSLPQQHSIAVLTKGILVCLFGAFLDVSSPFAEYFFCFAKLSVDDERRKMKQQICV